MKAPLLFAALMVLLPSALAAQTAQSAEAEVRAVIQRLFDGMRAGDSTVVRSVFHPEARLLTTGEREGASVLRAVPIDQFVAAVGTPHEEVWDERITEPMIQVDGDLATAWMDYAFYAGTKFSHCGVNAFQLFRGPEGWRVVQIADTRRRDGCSPALR